MTLEPNLLEIEPLEDVNFVPPETNTSQVGDANFTKEADTRRLKDS